MIEAKIIADSINPDGNRITTWLLTYPRFIHSEFMTHRVFSRNAASSRAIPIKKMIDAQRMNPAWPEFWGSNRPGMQAGDALPVGDEERCRHMLERLQHEAIATVASLEDFGLHKQVANRYIEPWAHMTVLATATDHSNFFKLRAHPAAQPEFQALAYRMLALYLDSKPDSLKWGDWHLPGVDLTPGTPPTKHHLKLCVAMACRASYSAFDEPIGYDDAERIHDRGVANGHWSPFEHAAQAISVKNNLISEMGEFRCYPWSNFDFPGQGGPSGWGQYRKLFETECARRMTNDQLADILAGRPSWVRI